MTSVQRISLFLAFVGPISATAAQPPEPTQPVNSDQLALWIRQLDADQYEAREQATDRLISAGVAAIEPIEKALSADRWEVTARGIFVLQELALSRSESTERAAFASLQEIAKSANGVVSRSAQEALTKIADLRSHRSALLLTSLGATIDPFHEEHGLYRDPLVAIEFGKKWHGQASDLRHLRWMPEIQQVSFLGEQVTDDWIAYLVGMQDLRAIKIRKANITDEATIHLKKLDRLEYVKLLYVPIGDDSVENLASCHYLLRMQLFGTKLTQKSIEQLTQVLGRQVLDIRKGAFLGVGTSSLDGNWFVNTVSEGSAADKAGLRPGDTLIEYDGAPVGDFTSFTELVSANEAGDTVTIRFRRGSQIIERQVTFGEWE